MSLSSPSSFKTSTLRSLSVAPYAGDNCHFFEGVCCWVGSDAICWSVPLVGQVFVLLAGGTSFHVVFDPGVHTWPPVLSFDRLDCFVSSWVSCRRSVMKVVQDVSFYLCAVRDHRDGVLEPLGVRWVPWLWSVGEFVSFCPHLHLLGSLPLFLHDLEFQSFVH
jgi:hypothetical protein